MAIVLATGFGSGYFPVIPGTAGSLVAIPISLLLNRLSAVAPWLAFSLLVVAVFYAIKISSITAEIMHSKDPQIIVIDEIVGFMVANFLVPLRLAPLTLSFVLFRIFDIAKVFPARKLEMLPGGSGIVLDDVLAGFYTLVIVQTLLYWRWL
jgi:phosphatidylglycerophosphatase A